MIIALNSKPKGILRLIITKAIVCFAANVGQTPYCEVELTEEKLQAFVYAVKNYYWYQMFVDDMPIWGIVGEVDENDNSYYLWTHKKLDIGYNGNRIVDVNLTSEVKVKLKFDIIFIKIFFTFRDSLSLSPPFPPSPLSLLNKYPNYNIIYSNI